MWIFFLLALVVRNRRSGWQIIEIVWAVLCWELALLLILFRATSLMPLRWCRTLGLSGFIVFVVNLAVFFTDILFIILVFSSTFSSKSFLRCLKSLDFSLINRFWVVFLACIMLCCSFALGEISHRILIVFLVWIFCVFLIAPPLLFNQMAVLPR